MKSEYVLFTIEGYAAVVPKIQNVYLPEKTDTGWKWGFKYDSGIFEFFDRKTNREAETEYCGLNHAITRYYGGEIIFEEVNNQGDKRVDNLYGADNLYGIDINEWNHIRTNAIKNGFDSPLKYVEHLEEVNT